jgi:hypothetical protein
VERISIMNIPFCAVVIPALAALFAGCTTSGPVAPSATISSIPVEVHLVVIGDSLASTGWPDELGRRASTRIGRPVTVDVLTAMGVADAAASVPSSPLVAEADIVVVQTGFNNVLPDPETGIGCGGSLEKGVTPWIKSTEPGCLAEGVRTYGDLYSKVFEGAKRARRCWDRRKGRTGRR